MRLGHGIEVRIEDDWFEATAFNYSDRLEQFCENDGLIDSAGLTDWFEPLLKSSPDGDMCGIIIHFTDFRYN